jgi:PRTRC genetic system protein E
MEKTMFKEIETMMGAETLSVSLVIVKNKYGLSVTVLPKPKEGCDALMSTPLALQGTAEELDADFVSLLMGYSSARKSLSEQLADTEAVIKAAQEASAKKGVDALKKGAKPAAAASNKAPAAQACNVGCDDDDEDLTAETPAATARASVPSIFAD